MQIGTRSACAVPRAASPRASGAHAATAPAPPAPIAHAPALTPALAPAPAPALAPAPSATTWPDATLDALRREADPAWDELWRALDRPTFERLLRLDLKNGEALPAELDLPPAVLRFFDETARLPAWADPARIERAQALFSRHGLPIVTVLLCASLPECYAAARGASILALSTNLQAHPERRILQTAQFLLDVMAPGGLGQGGRGVRRAQQVRLLHTVCRHGFLRHPGYRPEWGLPLNQEDMLGTLLSFSSVVMDALPRLGIDLSAQEEADYLHCWQVVGCVLGARPEQIPATPKAARHLAARIRQRHFVSDPRDNPAGVRLCAALVHSAQRKLPFQIFDGYVPVLVRHLCGAEVADALGVPEADWTRVVIGAGKAFARVGDLLGDSFTAYRAAAQWLGRRVLELAYEAETDGEPQHFSLPPGLARSWGLQTSRSA